MTPLLNRYLLPEEELPEGVLDFNHEDHEALQEKARGYRERTSTHDELETSIGAMKAEIKRLQDELSEKEGIFEKQEKWLEDNKSILSEAEASAVAFNSWKTSTDLKAKWDAYNFQAGKMDSLWKDLEAAQADAKEATAKYREALAEAVGPGGVRVDEKREVYIGETHWKNAAYSERILAAAMLQLAAGNKDTLPIVFIEHGESLNSEKQRDIARACIEAGATVFIEMMDESDDHLVITTDSSGGGEIIKTDGNISHDKGPTPKSKPEKKKEEKSDSENPAQSESDDGTDHAEELAPTPLTPKSKQDHLGFEEEPKAPKKESSGWDDEDLDIF